MIKKHLRGLIILSGVLLAVSFVAVVFAIISFFQSPFITGPQVKLENGGTIYIAEAGAFTIYLEDGAPPTLSSHDFIFTNTVYQNRTISIAPSQGFTYAIGSVTVNGEIRSGRFGRRVAQVELEPGNYIVEFQPWEGSGIFVWGVDMFSASIRAVIQLGIPTLALCVLIPVFIILVLMRKQQKSSR